MAKSNSTKSVAKKLVQEIKKSKEWHHDIKYIDGDFVEVTVKRWQETRDPKYIKKIIDNYAIFKKKWGRTFAPLLGNDQEDGESMHDKIVWKAACKFKSHKVRKSSGKAFNAYLVSSLMNQMKNLSSAMTSHKNHPRIKCPICEELVYQIDEKHLEHRYDLKRYIKAFPNYPLVSTDGMTRCPVTGDPIDRVTMEHVNRVGGRYLMEDFYKEFEIIRKGPYKCPLTGTKIKTISSDYLSGLLPGYTIQNFIEDFPNFPGLVRSPFTGELLAEMTQGHLDVALEQDETSFRYVSSSFDRKYPNFTAMARQVPVTNPYTGRKVREITPAMLAKAGTNVKEHLERFATTILDKHYFDPVICPFTGRRSNMIKTEDVLKLGKTVQEFYQATCKYPFRRFQVKCAVDGQWVDNIWSYLQQKELHYATKMDLDKFEQACGGNMTKLSVSTNSYVENDSGDCVHIADLFGTNLNTEEYDQLELQDSLMRVAEDEMDEKIATAIRDAWTLEDVYCLAGQQQEIDLGFVFQSGMTKEARKKAHVALGTSDFDLLFPPQPGASTIRTIVPSRQTIRKKLKRMIMDSDLAP